MEEYFPNEEEKPQIISGKKISLNFNDKDEKENAKFNDARLVDILRNYPLLYNKSLESYGDPDYTQWMWGEIASEMNEPHRKTTLNLPFNWVNTRDQWDMVKLALRYLSNPAAKSFRYPKQFRECLMFFQNYIKDRKEPPHTDRSQDTFINHTNLLDQMPFEKQLALEKEIMDVILSNELEFCAPIVDPQTIEAQAREEFSKVIGLLMPEVDVQIVQNELSTDSEPFAFDDFLQKTKEADDGVSNSIAEDKQLIEMYSKSENLLKRPVSHLDFDNLLHIPSKRVEIIVPDMEHDIQYSIQEIIHEDDAEVDDLEGVIEEDIIVEDMQGDDGQEIVLQECAFQEGGTQEDIIEEVVTDDIGKDMPSLDLEGQYEVPVNRLDFACVLNEMLE